MSTSDFSVIKSAPELVGPNEATPTGINLPLSFMDRLPTSRFLVESLHVYQHGEEPAKVIKAALSKALVPYYPMAGRFAISDSQHGSGQLEVACTGDGIWFVEAAADRSLEDVNYLQLPLMIPKEKVLPYFPLPENSTIKDVIMLIQVTEFKCGGFSIGIRSDHAMSGGSGIGQFMQAVVEMARGLSALTIKPVWGREAIPQPDKSFFAFSLPPLQALQPLELQNMILDVSPDQISQLKDHFSTETAGAAICSTFDVLLAKVWQSRARAIDLADDASLRVGFAASTRHLLKEFVPVGYYGNCGYPLTITTTRGKIANGSLVEVVRLIREAKEQLPVMFAKWMEGEASANPFRVPPDYGLLAVSDWSKVGFHELDYGWGEPMQVIPVDDNPFVASCVFLKPPAPKKGVRLLMRCVVKDHFHAFEQNMLHLIP